MTSFSLALDAETARRGRDLHHVLRDRLFVDLSRPERRIGERYQTEGEIAEQHGVSRNTVRRAVADLESEGYVTRRRGVGIIIQRKPLAMPGDAAASPAAANRGERERVIVVLPHWNDSPEGFFSRRFLEEISSPQLSPPLAVEIRHYNDTLTLEDIGSAAVVAIDPTSTMLTDLVQLQHRGIRVVAVSPPQPQPQLITVTSDRRHSVRDAVKRLYNLGHRRIGLMNHDPEHMAFSRAMVGFHDAHRELNLPMQPGAVCQELRYEKPTHQPDVKNITAWICTYLGSVDYVASACREAKLRVPRDVSIVSFDDPGEAPYASLGVAVTCIVPDYHEYVSRIHKRLVDWKPPQPNDVQVLSDLWVERDSVAAPRVLHK
jgi:DNA-binding LacI/PurR family transcriptional regulator